MSRSVPSADFRCFDRNEIEFIEHAQDVRNVSGDGDINYISWKSTCTTSTDYTTFTQIMPSRLCVNASLPTCCLLVFEVSIRHAYQTRIISVVVRRHVFDEFGRQTKLHSPYSRFITLSESRLRTKRSLGCCVLNKVRG